jgi:polysaccharide export outer membrane protein
LVDVSTTTESYGQADLERLALLWQSRTQEDVASDFPIGPGDMLEISVPDMEELSARTVQVSATGTISLPFVGEIQASELTQERLREEIRRRLEENYMYNPQVNLLVREYRSRQVAVVGAVEKPGLYNLASRTDTLLDMISMAGGLKSVAASRINFIPAEPIADGKTKEFASLFPTQLANTDPSSLILKRDDPIVIDLKLLTMGDNRTYLALPARPGDVIMVPGAGDIVIDGWVGKPGAYKITSGLTVMGAIAAAGGLLFAADAGSVKVFRVGVGGEKISLQADLNKIKRGEGVDLSLQEGDIIDVSASGAKLVPYGMYHFFSTAFRIGMSVPIF